MNAYIEDEYVGTADTPFYEDKVQKELEEAAYYNWINAGKPHNKALDCWLDAERTMFGLTNEEYFSIIEYFLLGDNT